ncbi:hypothetical protein [Caldalkalibacillus salinus]|uniref:hypothetical protein n=1 Tax=Caldalkalibacillus salinus TaxID=2803787 RepID=UPI001922D3B4|nr:hypothetical protein [Caldalkalibacillus salinus]
MANFQSHSLTIDVKSGKRIDHLDIVQVVEDTEGAVNVTDVMLQGGSVATVWTGHPSEIQWSFDG